MPCTIGSARSLGFAFLDYTVGLPGLAHRTHVHLAGGVSPLDLAILTLPIDNWGDLVAAILPSNAAVTGWGTQDADGAVVHIATFSPVKIGTHTTASGAVDAASRSLTLTGRGAPSSLGICTGEARTRIYVGVAFNWASRQRFLAAGSDAAVDALAAFLDANLLFWADFYGQPAGVRSRYPVQYNAYIQRRVGT